MAGPAAPPLRLEPWEFPAAQSLPQRGASKRGLPPLTTRRGSQPIVRLPAVQPSHGLSTARCLVDRTHAATGGRLLAAQDVESLPGRSRGPSAGQFGLCGSQPHCAAILVWGGSVPTATILNTRHSRAATTPPLQKWLLSSPQAYSLGSFGQTPPLAGLRLDFWQRSGSRTSGSAPPPPTPCGLERWQRINHGGSGHHLEN